jgi:hypothetical protein
MSGVPNIKGANQFPNLPVYNGLLLNYPLLRILIIAQIALFIL